MATDLKGNKILPGRGSPAGMRIEAVAAEAITKGQIVYLVNTSQSAANVATTVLGSPLKRRVGVATNATKIKSHAPLYIALNAAASAAKVIICPIGLLSTVTTVGATLGDPVYLGTAGAPTLTAAGFVRKIGTVASVGAAGTGVMAIEPGLVPISNLVPITQSTTVTGAASVTVLAATLGGVYGGAPVTATFGTVDGVKAVSSCTWSTNDLVITMSASTTGTIYYTIWA